MNTPLGSLLQCLITLSVKRLLLIRKIQNMHLHAISLGPIAGNRRDQPTQKTQAQKSLISSTELTLYC